VTDELKKIQDDIDYLKSSQKEFAKKQANNESTLSSLAADIKSHFKQESGFEVTLRNIDNTVKGIEIKLADDKFNYYKSLQNELHPVYNLIRDHKAEFAEFKTQAKVEHTCIGTDVERRIQYQAGTIVTIAAALIYFIYSNVMSDIKDNQHDIEKHVDNFNMVKSQYHTDTSVATNPGN
jgi:tRNA uridine 5-carbamoylmethylation protein Kti12